MCYLLNLNILSALQSDYSISNDFILETDVKQIAPTNINQIKKKTKKENDNVEKKK